MVCLLLYAYCVGVFSSRKIAQACERNLAFIAIVGQDRPDFRTISDFRKLHLHGLLRCVCAGAAYRGRVGSGEVGQCVDRWDQTPGQCVAAQSHELWLYEERKSIGCAKRLRHW